MKTNGKQLEYFGNLIDIGFCQPKFYKPSSWAKANRIMQKLCALNVGVKPHNFGRGKGKYINDGNLSHQQLAELLIKKT